MHLLCQQLGIGFLGIRVHGHYFQPRTCWTIEHPAFAVRDFGLRFIKAAVFDLINCLFTYTTLNKSAVVAISG
jgi:hypothetical protein